MKVSTSYMLIPADDLRNKLDILPWLVFDLNKRNQ